jgi:hypothetical protein
MRILENIYLGLSEIGDAQNVCDLETTFEKA